MKIILILMIFFSVFAYSNVFKLKTIIPENPFNLGLISSFDIDESGNVYVLDVRNNTLVIFDKSGCFKWLYPLKTQRAKDIRIFDGNIYILDPLKRMICKMKMDGSIVEWIKSKTNLYYPAAISLNQELTAISDYGNSRIVIIKGKYEYSIYSELIDSPSANCISNGDIFVCDWRNGKIFEYNLDSGRFINSFGGLGIGKELFFHPDGIVVKDGLIIISDWGNNKLQIYDKAGKYIMDYYGGKSGFRNPSTLRWKNGFLYVLDSYNLNIRKYSINFSKLKSSLANDIIDGKSK